MSNKLNNALELWKEKMALQQAQSVKRAEKVLYSCARQKTSISSITLPAQCFWVCCHILCTLCRNQPAESQAPLPKQALDVTPSLLLLPLMQLCLQALQQGRANRIGEQQKCKSLPRQCLLANS